MQGIERNPKEIETLNKIQDTINSLHEDLISRIRKEESQRLQEYKNQLMTKKIDFQKINLGRSENAITQNIMARKKALQKECAISLQKSMKASKMYEQLKQKLNHLEAEERQMQLQTKYLQKRIIVASNKNKGLKKIKQQIWEEKQNILTNHQVIYRSKYKLMNFKGLELQNIKKQPTHKMVGQKGNKISKNAQKRLKFRIECIKQYLQSLIFVKTDLQKIFQPFIDGSFIKMSEKEKLQAGEQILSKAQVKEQLYHVLFPS